MNKKILYAAYGSNINLEQMAYRCPNSKVAGTAMLKGYELEFRGVATIVPKENESFAFSSSFESPSLIILPPMNRSSTKAIQ